MGGEWRNRSGRAPVHGAIKKILQVRHTGKFEKLFDAIYFNTRIVNTMTKCLIENTLFERVGGASKGMWPKNYLWQKEHYCNISMDRQLPGRTIILHHQQPLYLAKILPRYTPSWSLRSSSSITISAPFRKTSMATSKSFSSTPSLVWNKLPTHVSSALKLPVFRWHLKHHFFLDAYSGFTVPTIRIEGIAF